jgi:hypothetical protein
MNTIAPAKTRFKTLSAAEDEIENLERQIVVLNAELAASKTTAAAKTQTPTQPTAPAVVNQPTAAAAPSAVERPLAEISKRELTVAMDEAGSKGDHASANRFYSEYCRRK